MTDFFIAYAVVALAAVTPGFVVAAVAVVRTCREIRDPEPLSMPTDLSIVTVAGRPAEEAMRH